MARSLTAILIARCSLLARTPFHVGGLGGDATADLTLARDGLGRLFVPGTSLAGVLRALFLRLAGQQQTNLLFGHQQGDDGAASHLRVGDLLRSLIDRDRGRCSHLRVGDLLLPDGLLPEFRDGVMLDRFTGAAADRLLYSRQVAPAGTVLPLRLELEIPAGKQGPLVERAAQRLLGWLARPDAQLTLGAASSRGLGHFTVQKLKTWRLDLSRVAHLQAWWQLRAGRQVGLPADAIHPVAPRGGLDHLWRVEVRWRPLGPIMVKARLRGEDADMLPLASQRGDTWRVVIPGSSLRGALRSRAERIVRSLVGQHAPPDENPLQQVNLGEDAGIRAVNDLFGRARARRGEGADTAPARGMLAVEDCWHGQALPRPPWEWSESNHQPWPGFHRRSRIAVDRWTGGALDSALFTVLEPTWEPGVAGATWEPFVFHLDTHLLASAEAEPHAWRAMALFWLLLRDLTEGLLPVGFGTLRGFGQVGVTQVDIHTPDGQRITLPGDLEHPGWSGGEPILQGHFQQWQRAWSEPWSA